MNNHKQPKMNKRKDKHKEQLNRVTREWGKTKFKPFNPRTEITPNPEPTAKPWQHVKNDIIDASEEMNSAGRLNVESEEAKKFMQQREKNHRKNIIEAKRMEATKWEAFDDEPTPQKKNKNKKPKDKATFKECGKGELPTEAQNKKPKDKATFKECRKGELPTDVKNFTFKERNFYTRKITLGLTSKKTSLDNAIFDLRKNGFGSHCSQKKGENPFKKHKKPFYCNKGKASRYD